MNILNQKRIMVFAAHPDDEILGVGATLAKYRENGAVVKTIILGEGITSRDIIRVEKLREEEISSLKGNITEANLELGISDIYCYDLPDNRFDQVDLLDIVKIIEKEIESFKPDTIFTHWENDLNIDHQLTFKAVMTATRPMCNYHVKDILVFETVSASEWNFGRQFNPNCYICIDDQIEKKIKALQHYTSEMRDFPHPRSIEGIKILAQKRGMESGCSYAEAFQIIRMLR